MDWQKLNATKMVLGMAVLGITGVVWADDSTPQPTTQQQIQQLEKKVEKLEAADKARATTQPSSSSVAPTPPVGAQYQSGFFDLSKPFTVGWDNGFVLRSGDRNFSFHPSLVLDVRNMTSYREQIPAKGGGEVANTGNDTQNGFDLTRARITFDGSLFKQITYFFQFQDDQGTAFSLLDAYGMYHFDQSPFSIKVGQFKDPVFHERNVSEANLLAVDRSMVESLLGGGQTGRVQGAAVVYDKDQWRGQAVIHDGFNSLNTKFFDAGGIGAGVGGGAGVTPTDFGASGRAEYMLIGNRTADFIPWTEYDQFTSLHARKDILVLGIGADYSQANSNNVLFHSLDVQFNDVGGFSFYAAYLGTNRDIHTNQGVKGPGIFYDPGFMVQAAYVFDQRIEPFARYDYTHLAPRSVTGLATDQVQEATLGVNYYLYGQHAKVTVDGSWLPNGAPTDIDALGILKDSGHNEFMLRAQFQLWI